MSPDFTGGMRIASAMVRPHVVNFMDQMMHSDEGLRVEEVVVSANFSPSALARSVPKSTEYLVMAIHEGERWIFNPHDDQVLSPGMTLVLMASPDGRSHVERLLSA